MPGIHLVFSPSLEPDAVNRIPAGLVREPGYSVSTVFHDHHLLCVLSSYPNYPLATSHPADTFIAFEGMVYNMNPAELDRRIAAISRCMGNGDEAAREVAALVDEADGEFLAVLYNAPLKTLLMFNDRWGRLPAYVYRDDHRLVVSRELKFILPWLSRAEFDPLGVADFLLFEFVPGEGTIVKDVKTLTPAICICASARDGKLDVSVTRVATECLDDPRHPMSRDECCDRFKDLLLEATACRVDRLQSAGYRLTADLSGGFDSRVVCAALAQVGAPASLYTDALVTGDESTYAQKVADTLDLPLHRVITHREVTEEELTAITLATDCTVNAWTSLASRHDSLARRQLCGIRSVRFLGLGAGEFIKRVPKLKHGYRSIARQMAAGHQVGLGSMNAITSLTHISVSSMCQHIDSVLAAYPERTNKGHLKRWHSEYERKLVTYGEDRSRAWIWPVAPLWSRGLYEFALTEIPECHGHGASGLYFPLLQLFAPSLADVPVFSSVVVSRHQAARLRRRVLEALVDGIRYFGMHVPGISRGFQTARRLCFCQSPNADPVCTHMLTDLLHEPNVLWDTIAPQTAASALSKLSAAHSWRLLTLALYGKHLYELRALPTEDSRPPRQPSVDEYGHPSSTLASKAH